MSPSVMESSLLSPDLRSARASALGAVPVGPWPTQSSARILSRVATSFLRLASVQSRSICLKACSTPAFPPFVFVFSCLSAIWPKANDVATATSTATAKIRFIWFSPQIFVVSSAELPDCSQITLGTPRTRLIPIKTGSDSLCLSGNVLPACPHGQGSLVVWRTERRLRQQYCPRNARLSS